MRPTRFRSARAIVLAALMAALMAVPAHAGTNQPSLFEAPRELLSSDDALRTHTLDELQAFGVQWVRLVVLWHNVAPTPDSRTAPVFDSTDPAAYPGFNTYDRAISEIRARGMKVLVTVSGPVPKWATATKQDWVTRPDPARFERFMTAVGRHWRDVVDAWSIWNEPNHPKWLMPQYTGVGRRRAPVSGQLYRPLYLAAQRALVATGHAGDPVLIGETAPRGGAKAVAPLAFMRGLLCLSPSYRRSAKCGRLATAGWSHHAYTTAVGPWFKPLAADDVTIGVLGRLTSALDRAGRAGALPRHLPVYLTEFGIQSWPDPYIGVPLPQQAEFRSIAEKIAYDNPRVAMFSQYLMRDDNPRPGNRLTRYSGFESGLRLAGGAPKPSYEGYRLPLVAKMAGPSAVTLWGLVRPHAGSASLTVEVMPPRARRWSTLARVTTNARGYWRRRVNHRTGTVYRVVWTGPDGTVYRCPATRAYSY